MTCLVVMAQADQCEVATPKLACLSRISHLANKHVRQYEDSVITQEEPDMREVHVSGWSRVRTFRRTCLGSFSSPDESQCC